MSKLSDLNASYIHPAAPKQEEDGNFKRGFKKAMVQIPETIGGTIGLAGDILGADGMRDYGMGIYEKNKKVIEGLTRDSDSISNVMDGNGSVGDWLASGAGYVGGQVLTAIGTGGIGGLIGKQIAKRGIAHVIERGAESQIAKQVAENAMSKGVKYGAGAAALGSNLTQEAGSIYPEALAQAQEEGRTLDGWDKARVVGSALAAAGVDTAMEAFMVNKVLGGGRRAIKDAAGNAVNESALRAMAREIPAGMAREGVTEGVQTGIERVGAGQDLGSKDAVKDYVDSIALGTLGGGLGGAGASFSKQRLPETGALSKAANAGIDAENTLRLENRPDPLVSFRDGTVGRQSEVDAHINSLPENERMAARAQLLGMAPQPIQNDAVEPISSDNDWEQTQIDEEQRQAQIEQLRANAEPKIAVPEPTGSFSQVDQVANQIQQEKQQAIASDNAELQAMQDEQDRAEAAKQQEALDAQIADTDARVQAGDAQAIAGRRTELLDGILASKDVDGLSQHEIGALYQKELAGRGVVNSFMLPHEVEKVQRFDDARAAVLEDSQKADEPVTQVRSMPNEMPDMVRERKELPGPVDGTNFKSVDDAIAAGKTLQVVNGKNVLRKGTGAVFKLNTDQHEYYLSKVSQAEPEVKAAAPAQVLTKSGKPFAEKFAAKMKQKELGDVHDIVSVNGGYALQAKVAVQAAGESEQSAPVVAEQAPEVKVSAPIVDADIQPADIKNGLGKPFTVKYAAIAAQAVHGGTVTAVDGGYVVRPDVKTIAENEQQAASGVPDVTEGGASSVPVAAKTDDSSAESKTEQGAENSRNSITFERSTGANDVESVTLARGDFVSVYHSAGGKSVVLNSGEVEGISHANREVKVKGQWHDVMTVATAKKPAEIKPKTTPLSSVIDSANAKTGEGLTDADRVVNTLADHQEVMKMARDGTIKVDALKSAYASVKANESALKEQMASIKKDDLLEAGGGMFAYRNKTEKKDDIIKALFNSMLAEFALGKDGGVQYVIGGGMNGYETAKRKSYDAAVESLTQETLDSFAAEVKTAREEYIKKVQVSKAAIADPKTLNDFTAYMRDKTSGGESVKDAFMSLSADQRAEFDRLAAEKTRAERATRKEEKQEAILRAPGEPVTASEIIKTQHTKHGHDLWQFDLDQRVSREEYDSLLAQAKRLGGSYSGYRKDGAIPGWQFKSEESAKAFKALIAGDKDAAKDVMQNRRDAFSDDRSQSASERLNEMAQSLEDNSQESLNRDRKTNTSRRAGMASRAESAARSGVAFAKTMRNVAGAIDSGDAKFLDKVREKKQIELLAESVRAAWVDQSRAKGLSYEDIQNGKAAPANRETADFATFPAYTAFRSDLASLARQLLEVDGTKKLGKRLMDVADDVSDTYLAFAKDSGNLRSLMGFSAKGGGIASFSSKPATEAAIARSGYRGKAIPFMVKRGEYTIIYSPSEAISRGVWTGDGDKRITLSRDYGTELVESIGRANRKGNKVSVPWQFESTFDKHKTLARMGIETAAEYRSSLREFVGLREQAEAPSKIKELERAMVGRQNDGMDFFPTPEAVADEMIHAADIQPGMTVLEPSAGWGHIAERIREAGVEPDVVELSGSRRELLEAKGFSLVGGDFLEVAQSDVNGGYDRIIMNPPFSDRRDSEHVQHAYSLLKPGGRLVAIMGEGVFFGKDKSALAFRDWIDSVGGTDEKLAAGTFLDSSLPVNTGVNARMVVINKPESAPVFSRTQKNYMFGIPNEILEEEVAAISKNWKNAPKINIVEYANELPFEAPSDARGAYHKGQVYLVASNIRSKEEAQMVLFHEALGHAGLRGALGEELAPALRAIGIQNRSIAEAAAKWRKENADIRGSKTDDQFLTSSIEEALADMAGTGRQIKALEKLLAAVQKALRAIGLNSVANWMEGASDAEALSLLTAARQHIQSGNDSHVFTGEHVQALSRNDGKPSAEEILAMESEEITIEALAPPIATGEEIERAASLFLSAFPESTTRHLPNSATVRKAKHYSEEATKDLGGAGSGSEGRRRVAQNNNLGPFTGYNTKGRITQNFYGNEQLTIDVWGKEQIAAGLDIIPALTIELQSDGEFSIYALPSSSDTYKEFVARGWAEPATGKNKEIQYFAGEDGEFWTKLSGSKHSDIIPLLGDIHARALAWTDKPYIGLHWQRTTGASGGIDGHRAAVLFSRSGKGSFADAHDILRSANTLGEATSAVKSLLESNSKFNIWDRTVGTQFGKGKKDADFKKVFDASQQQIDDVAHFSIEAERLAPSILRRLDSIKDNFRAVLSNDTDHKANLKAVSQALFDNIEGKQGVQQKVFSNGELRKQFGLNDKQIEMYREARLSVDTSLERLSQSIIASMGQSNGMDIVGLKNASMVDTAKAVQGHLGAGDAHDKVDELLTFTRELQNKGYMPAMRFGEHTVLATDPKTKEVVYFGMHENAIAANIDLMEAKKDFPGMVLEKGRLNKDAFAMFKGVSPETVELFAKFTGTDKNAAVQEYIALAKAGRSSMKRMLERQGIAGFSKDIDRVMASFITSNARQTALNANAYLVTEALSSESLAKKGDVQREAQKLVEYLANPLEEAQKLRGFLFLHFIGGSLASAAVNLTQPILQTTPFLSQYAGSKTVGIMAAAAKMAATGTIENKELAAAMARAKSDGITDPHEIHNLMADASGSTLGSSVKARAVTKLWGSFFSASEAYNRRLTFLAGYQTAQGMSKAELMKAGFDNAYDFAKNAIIETQGLYSKANRPNWARGAVGATLFTFKQFSISYVEFLNRLPRQQKMLALGILVAAAGLQGLPFAEDIEDLIDTIGQSLGHNTNSKKALRNTAKEYLGETLGNILTNGLSTQAGADLQGRLGMGNLLPGTAAFKPSETDKTRDAWEMAGAIGGLIQAFQKSIGKVQQGDIFSMQGAIVQMAPGAVKNALMGAEMASSGYYKDGRGRNVEKVDLVDSALKAIGLQPQHIAEGSRRRGAMVQDSNMVKAVQSGIADSWAHAIANSDQEGIAAARKEMQDWNEKNPDSRIKMDMTAIRHRVIEIRRTASERMIKSTPKLLRAGAREELM